MFQFHSLGLAGDADFDLRLIEPTAVSGRVMDGEAIPDFCSHFRAEDGGQRFPAMDVEFASIRNGLWGG